MIEEGKSRAQAILMASAGPAGLLGSASAYPQVWARDSMICGLALNLLGGEAAEIHARSLATLQQHQSALGRIPHNVGADGPDTAHAGCIDNNLWYIVGRYHAWRVCGTSPRDAWASILAAYRWLEYQDSNECGLLEAHEAMDWADLFANRYNSLYPNVLWFAVQKCMAAMAEALGEPAALYLERVEDVRFKVNTLLWVGGRDMAWVERHRKEWLYPIRLTETLLVDRPYYLPYMGFREYADRFDTLGNLLAIFFGLADAEKTARILDYVRGAGIDQPWPVRALNRAVQPGERDWRDYYRLRNLNLPDQYHNGGAWPFIGGFYVAALVAAGRMDEARQQLARLAEMNRQSRNGAEWEFNEWFHGRSGRPMGFAGQSWSAAMFIYAAECVAHGACPGFER